MNGSLLCSLAAGPAAALTAAPVYSQSGTWFTSSVKGSETALDFTGRFQGANVGGTRFPLRALSLFDHVLPFHRLDFPDLVYLRRSKSDDFVIWQ
jgi:hypothetical protein